MPNSGYAFGDQPALDDIARTDLLLDALADRERIDLDDPQVDALAVLMGDWRDDLRWPPASALVSAEEAIEALRTGLAERRRARRGLAAIGSVAATLLVLSGFGALVADAHRGDPLYGLHVMFFDAPRVNDDTDHAVCQGRSGQGSANDRPGPMGSGPESAGRGQQHRAGHERREQPAKPDGRGEPAEHQGGVAKPQRDAAARLAAVGESPGSGDETEGVRGIQPLRMRRSAPPTVASSTTPSSSSPAPSGRRRHHGQSADPSVAPSAGP